ncbi:MAG TPA: DUF1549 domain-containing protein [Planctomycetota bacterium]|nr:DUF1549 domain-containing protein [Planctomycetota bacterium]
MKTLAWGLILFAVPGDDPQGEPRRPSVSGSIDGAVGRKAGLASDGEFLRRVMLNLVGYPPTAQEVKDFQSEARPGKRIQKIEELLAREDFADLWSRMFAEVFFGDYHNVTMDTSPKLSKAASARIVGDFVQWLKMKIQKDRPWTEIVGEILEARGKDEADPALAYKLAMYNEEGHVSEFATRTARHFLGIRLLCAKCHDHPFDQWTDEHFYGLAAFNARIKTRPYGASGEKDASEHVEVSYADEGEAMIPPDKIVNPVVKKTKTGGPAKPVFLFGGMAPPGLGVDRMKHLVPLMTGRANKQLPKALVNRVWGWLMGRGLVSPVDDFNQQSGRSGWTGLLETLTSDLQQNGVSIKHLVRAITNSQAYQLSSSADGAVDRIDFSRGTVLQLSGEQLLNSIAVATKGKPGRNIPEDLLMVSSLFPAGAVWCETTPLPGTARQALLLRNNAEIQGWISGGGVLSRIKSAPGPVEEKLDEMFLAAVSRRATDAERARYAAFIARHPDTGFEDAYWTLLNTTEFVTRH